MAHRQSVHWRSPRIRGDMLWVYLVAVRLYGERMGGELLQVVCCAVWGYVLQVQAQAVVEKE